MLMLQVSGISCSSLAARPAGLGSLREHPCTFDLRNFGGIRAVFDYFVSVHFVPAARSMVPMLAW